MSILSRYLVRTWLTTTATCLGAFVAIYLVVDFLERFGKFSRAGVPSETTLLYFLCKIPEMVSMTTPMAVLMGTILAIGLLTKNCEITAMRSSGVSLLQIGRPILVAAAVTSLLLLFMKEFVTPASNSRMNQIDQVFVKKKGLKAAFRQNNIWHRDDNLILQAKLFNPDTNTLSGVTIWELGPGLKPLSRMDAASGTPVPGGWQFAMATTRNFTAAGEVNGRKEAAVFKKLDLGAADLKNVAQAAEDMGFTALWRYCRAISDNGFDATPYLTMLHAKISLPFAALIMAFLGIPFSLRDGRAGGIGIGIGISIGIGFTYFIINSLLLALGQAGALPPVIAAWSANMIFAGAGLWFTLKVDG
jgi:lipopolysaccharide export system permease protein